jgi:hypothetical protein
MRSFHQLDAFTQAYIECALWSSTDISEDGNMGAPLDDNYGPEDISDETMAQIVEDCAAFQADNADDIGTNYEQAGHDFWLTRNRHGAGFWDGDWPEDAGKRLTEAAHAYGSVDLLPSNDGKLYA